MKNNIHLIPTDKPSRLFLNVINNKLLIDDDNTLEKVLPSGSYQNIYITSDEYIGLSYYLDGNLVRKGVIDDKEYWKVRKDYKKIILTNDIDLIQDGIQPISDEFLQWFVKNPSCEWVEVKKRYSDFTVDPFVGYQIIIPQENPDRLAIPLDCTHDIVIKYGVAECQNCGLEESKISKQLTDLEIEREERKQETLVEKMIPLQLKYNLDNMKQETVEEAALSFLPHSEVEHDTDFIIGFEFGAKWQAERMYSEEEVFNLLNNFNKDTLKLRSLKLGNSFNVKDWFSQFKKQNNEI
jgi:hypothetical protein